jgi:hypothetical protein
MFRNRVRPPTPPLDEVTAERLLRGAPIEDLPDAYRPLGLLLADATGPAAEEELTGSAAAAAQFVAVHEAATEPKRRTRSMAGSVLLVFALTASTGTAVAATQGALPGPVQQVAHEALATVGISVPGITNGDGEGGGRDGSGDSTPTIGVSTPATPSATTPTGVGSASVPAAGSTDPATNPVAGDDTHPAAGEGGGPGGDGGDNPNAGPGNDAGQGNPNPGDGNQGNPAGGGGNDGNQGNLGGGGGNQGNHGNPGNQPSDPGANLPSPSDGKGNGPPQVPPGQAKKLG